MELERVKKEILKSIRAIPKTYRKDRVVKETIRCVLYGMLIEQGYQPVPCLRKPSFPEGPVDIAGLGADETVKVAFCANPTVELDDVKSLERLDPDRKVVISFSPAKKKVDMSTFFLKGGIEHLYIYETGCP